jgi:hypothetical protein
MEIFTLLLRDGTLYIHKTAEMIMPHVYNTQIKKSNKEIAFINLIPVLLSLAVMNGTAFFWDQNSEISAGTICSSKHMK